MENTESWTGKCIKMEVVETIETKPNMKAQIPFLADYIKLEQQLKKSDSHLNNEAFGSWVCKNEIIHEKQLDWGKDLGQPGPYVEDNKIHIKDELCTSVTCGPVNSQEIVQEMKSQCDVQHFQLVGPDNFSETLSDQARNFEQIKESAEDSEIIDDTIKYMAETTENRDLHLSVTPRGQGVMSCKGSINLFKCNVCGRGFIRNSYLMVHKRTHTGEEPYKCDVCGKGFRQNYELIVHKRTHTGEEPYKCDVCSKVYRQNIHLICHKRTHTGEEPQKCDVCGKGFRRNSHLMRHKRTHTGEKPYKCDICDKGFNVSSYVMVHKRTHTGEEPYKCDVCGKGFKGSSGLIVHKRKHTGEKPYKCDLCSKGYCTNRDLIIHKRKHTGEKPYKCDVCGKGFTQNGYLIVHKRTHTVDKCDV